MMIERPAPEAIIEGLTTTSAKIRALAKNGYERTEISKLLGVRYQFVRNVLVASGVNNSSHLKAVSRRPHLMNTAPQTLVSVPRHNDLLGNGFECVPLQFYGDLERDVFSSKNNKTLAQTVRHEKYINLASIVSCRYSNFLDRPLGEALLALKLSGDPFYKKFLNTEGDRIYSRFRIADGRYLELRGVYVYVLDGRIMYIGRCKDSMKKRIDYGYGVIHPKNCYRDGQSTNCHLNACITATGSKVELWLRRMDLPEEIEELERILINVHNPPWNRLLYS